MRGMAFLPLRGSQSKQWKPKTQFCRCEVAGDHGSCCLQQSENLSEVTWLGLKHSWMRWCFEAFFHGIFSLFIFLIWCFPQKLQQQVTNWNTPLDLTGNTQVACLIYHYKVNDCTKYWIYCRIMKPWAFWLLAINCAFTRTILSATRQEISQEMED